MKNIYIIAVCLFALFILGNCSSAADSSPSMADSSSDGQGGSLARFCIANDYLYVVDNSTLHVYSIANPEKPVKTRSVNLGFGIETIFYYEDFLYIGSNNGMLIYGIANPSQPALTGTYSHVFSCDPVVVQGDIAYVTLRTGTRCNRGVNQLEVIDVSNKANPVLIKTIPMSNPWGLGVDGKHLFVCESAASIAYLDLSDPLNPVKMANFPVKAMDVIVSNNVLLTTGSGGIAQFDYSNVPSSLDLLSKIDIGK